MGDRGRLATTGHPQLGQDPRDVDAGRLGGDEQFLADLPVGAALGDQGEHLGLPAGQAKRGGQRRCLRTANCWVGWRLQLDATALGKQLELAA